MIPVQKIIKMLDDERDLLVTGRYGELPALVEQKERIFDELESAGHIDPDALAAVASRSRRNAELIEAAKRGLAKAQAQIRDIRCGMNQTTYGIDGERRPLANPDNRLEQKL